VLLFVTGQKSFYLDVAQAIVRRTPREALAMAVRKG
jgi:hypothetical protein